MKRRFLFTTTEVIIALGVVALLTRLCFPVVVGGFFAFLKSLPWNP